MSKSVEQAVEKIGDWVNAQLTFTWNTRQTAEQYAEIREQSGEPSEFDLEEFAEYVKDNFMEHLRMAVNHNGVLEVFVLDSEGDVVRDE